MNIDKDIEILKEYLEPRLKNLYNCEFGYEVIRGKQLEAMSNVLSELETYKKIAKRLAKEILSIHHPMFNMVTVNNIEALIEGARKEVEKDEL